ncbi:MAG: DNA mismatch repair endonuclease MutL [Phycisphaerales bacterium]
MARAATNRPIRLLSPTVASQIAAGEVIERPASVVKELVENAIDAGARSIVVELEAGGMELVRVTDDGSGIPSAELPLATTAHATSKIGATEDLDHIATLGFRGEAIASIASVARLTIRSRVADEDAAMIRADAGVVGDVTPASGPVGTQVEVRNLFYATPARRKFLKTPQTERGRCLAVVRELALANPAVGFRLESEGRVTLDVEPGQSPRERVLEIIGRELEPQLLEVHADEFDDARGVALWGLVGRPEIARPTAASQHVFVSGRPVRDRTIQHALREAFRGLMEHTRFPTAVLLLEMSPESVDVNVHPAKAEVRFRDSGHVHSVVLRAVREALRGADLTPAVQGAGHTPFMGAGVGRDDSPEVQPEVSRVHGVGEAERLGGFVEFFARRVPQSTGGRLSFEALREAMEPPSIPRATDQTPDDPQTAGLEPADRESIAPREAATRRPALQVHNSYVVTQDEQGVVIVDQHALHERVMFEYLMERLGRGPLESQAMLVPEVVEASPAQMEAIESLGPLLEQIGVELAALGPTSVGVSAFPSFLFDRGVEIRPFVSELLERASESAAPPTSEEALRQIVDMMSCKAAVKAGDRLGGEELARLLELREEVERSSSCPHGRPTSVRLTLAQLEKLFHRT